MLSGSPTKRENEPVIGIGARERITLGATLAIALVLVACERAQEPAEPATPAPAAQPAAPAPAVAAVERVPDGTDPLTHGRYLVETVAGCGNCHTPHLPDGSLDESMAFSGAFVIEEPIFRAYAKNITPDMETGIGSWTDDEIVNAIRNAKRPDGTPLGPPMSFGWYKRMSDTEVRAIVAYLRTLRPIRNEVTPSTYQIPLEGFFGPDVTSVPDVPKTDIVKYGEYLAGPVGHCMDCHTPIIMGVQDMANLGRGGYVFHKPFIYDWSAVAANITPHEQGLGGWTDAEIKRAITQGISRDGRTLLPFMPYGLYAKMQESDLDALVAYLRSIPPLPDLPPAAEPAE
jgi:mono/diheme cytochrome c family protein